MVAAPSSLQAAESAVSSQNYQDAIEQYQAVIASNDKSDEGLREKETALLGLGKVYTKLK
jgi:hypothetical protein